jgi:hypothetical protein
VELYKLVDDIFGKLKENSFYSEIPIENLKDSIFEHLNSNYNDMVDELGVYFNIKKMSGDVITDKDYDDEFSKIGVKLNTIIEEISRTK